MRLERLTPELVLVSPELGEAARALLPERPWETFHRPQSVPPAPPAPVPLVTTPREALVPREPVFIPRVAFPLPLGDPPRHVKRPAAPVNESLPARRRGLRLRSVASACGAGGVLAVLIVGSLPIVPDAPVLEARLKQTRGEVPVREAAPTQRPGPKVVGGGGYAGEALIFRTSPDGSEVMDVTAETSCGKATTPGPVAIGFDGSFSIRFGKRPVVVVRGAFTSSTSASGTVRGRDADCDSGSTPFVASLS
jgi:hypothetical protein